jgi:hypothetical protein
MMPELKKECKPLSVHGEITKRAFGTIFSFLNHHQPCLDRKHRSRFLFKKGVVIDSLVGAALIVLGVCS